MQKFSLRVRSSGGPQAPEVTISICDRINKVKKTNKQTNELKINCIDWARRLLW